MHRALNFLAAAAAVLGAGALAQAEDFYKGKTVTLVINLSAGGATSILAQSFANYWGKNTPGNPNMVVQAMPGGGQLKAINFVTRGAKPDGLTIGWMASSSASRAAGRKSQQVDWSIYKDTMIAGVGNETMAYARRDIKPGISNPADIVKAEKVILGGLRPGSRLDVVGRLGFELLGVKYVYVKGYRGGSKVNAALLQNEVQAHNTPPAAYLGRIKRNTVDSGIGIPLWYYAAPNLKGGMKRNAAMEAAGVRPFHEVFRAIKGRAPSGVKWEAIKWVSKLADVTSTLVFAPPKTPKDRLEVLRASFLKTTKDPEYIQAVKKQVGLVPSFHDVEEVTDAINSIVNVDPNVLNAVKDNIAASGR